ncbi:MAG TPA: hypothetical protein VIV35_12675, partial [Chitinophagaceae bacterium]
VISTNLLYFYCVFLPGAAATKKQITASGKGYHQKSFNSDKCEEFFPILFITMDAMTAITPITPKTVFLFIIVLA